MERNFLEVYNTWKNSDYLDNADIKELEAIANDEKEIEERFYKELEFGTGGMRGIRGVGSNRINKYVIRKSTQGLANYIIKASGDEGKENGVVIAYDCRIGSVEFALNAALVLAANGIKTYLFSALRSTPELSFAVRELGAQSGIVVTASHNPKEYNGYKVYWNYGGQLVEPHASGLVSEVNKIEKFEQINLITEAEAIKNGLLIYIDKELDDKYIEAIKKESLTADESRGDFKFIYTPLHGTGGRPVLRVLKEMGYDGVEAVPEQLEGDGNFPTCAYANPEDPAVFKLAMELADSRGATLCIANDPDADRTGIAVKSGSEWIFPNGNQLGLLLMNYILETRKDIPKNATVVSTIVSTSILDVITAKRNIGLIRTLTGFKFIGEKMEAFEKKTIDGSYLIGFEESYGYLIGEHARDKDGIVTALIVAEMALYYQSRGLDLVQKLDEIYKEYGYYIEDVDAITKSGKSGSEEIANIMNFLRNNAPQEVAGIKVKTIKDFQKGVEVTGAKESKIELPSSNVLQFILEDGSYITARPSGTEPKIKYYYSVCDADKSSTKEKLKTIRENFLMQLP